MYKRLMLLGLLLVAFAAIASPASAANTNCSGVFVGATFDDVTVLQNDACTLVDSTVTGKVNVKQNAYFEADNTDVAQEVKGDRALTVFLHNGSSAKKIDTDKTFQVFAFDSSLTENLKVERTTSVVNVCGMTIGNDLEVKKSGQDILIGDPLTVDCAGNSVGHNVKVEENSTDVELIVRGNTVGNDMKVNKNTGPSDKAVEGNTGGHKLECKENTAPFTASGNPGWEQKTGQCTAP